MVVENGKKYMVYLLNSPYSKNQPNDWLCGGVLVSTRHVLTSAACLTEVSHIYVIAGYRKYVSGDKIQDDECTRTRKQKIVKIVIPKAYNQSTWMQYDVGLGVVEKRYNFFDFSYRRVCSYEPGAISINYNLKMEAPISYVVALGWGAAQARKPGMVGDMNSKYLMQAQAIITNTSYCRKQFPQNFEYLFLCTHGLNDVVKIKVMKKEKGIISSRTSPTGKPVRHIKKMSSVWRCGNNGNQTISKDTPEECVDMDSTEMSISWEALHLNSSDTSSDKINDNDKTISGNKLDINDSMRKRGVPGKYFGGICQNDHGGPLIAFVGDAEVIVGVALNSVYDIKYQCEGPFLYLSTARSVNLIKCLFTFDKEKRKKCYSMNYDRIEYYVDWPSEQQTIKSYGYGEGYSQARSIPVRIRPSLNMGLQYS